MENNAVIHQLISHYHEEEITEKAVTEGYRTECSS
jgi:hypothetical protein